MYGYAGQGYPIYGQPTAGSEEELESTAPEAGVLDAPPSGDGEHPSFLHPERGRADDEQRHREQDMPWLADPASSAFAFGYTTSLGASHPSTSSHGGHAGKGPKDYLRADSRVREDVCDRLSDDDAVDASEISVEVSAGEVTLSGAVLDRYSKRRAEDIAAQVRGVVDVRNHLHVHKGLWNDLGAELTGSADVQHHGHHGAGPRHGG